MNRRAFLAGLSASMAMPAMANINELFVPKDSLLDLPSTILKHDDVFLEKKYHAAFQSVRKKLKQVQQYVGHGNFNIISFDEARYILARAKHTKALTKEELEFIEYIFYYQPQIHGFYGDRISMNLTDKINKKDVKKIPYTGHYLFKGKPEQTYYQLTKDIGNTLILTSGVRSIVKQMKLFLDKLDRVDMNLSEASISIAPPAFTYHSIGDFDVGKKGLGSYNFTARFALTPEFKEIKKLKYVDMRYTIDNKDGVRYEPWHVKII